MPGMAQLHGSVKEIWEGVNENYVHPVNEKINAMKKTDTYMPTLIIKCFNVNVL